MADEPGTTIIIKKIKKAGHGHHGGAWKVAYADFVTAMMAFFLVMWIVGMSQENKEGIQKYFNDPIKLFSMEKFFVGLFDGSSGTQMMSQANKGGVIDSKKTGGLSKVHLIARELEKNIEPFKSEISDFKVHPDRIQFAITAQKLFSPGNHLLRPESEPVLRKIAQLLQGLDANILIEAHTDDIQPDNPEYQTNWELSALRAATVVRYFVEVHKFDPARISLMGSGEFRPVANNATPEGRAKNRRIDIYIIPDKDNRIESAGKKAN